MKTLFFDGDRRVHIEEVEIPRPGPNEVLVQVACSGVCQTEFGAYVGAGSKKILGHEFSGRVVEVGEAVRLHKVGDRVVCHPFMPCGTCSVCRSGRTNICRDR